MKNFIEISDIDNLSEMIGEAIQLKKNPFQDSYLGINKTLVMLFFNSSLRTRLSTEKAAKHLGMHTIVLNVNDSWSLEFEDGTIMNMQTVEHIKEAAQVISEYADMIAVRSFAGLTDKEKDQKDEVLQSFRKYASVPIVNMESSVAHPLQALADAMTIEELNIEKRPKIVLSWAPHPKPLPQAVPNSFVAMMRKRDVELMITHPDGYELNPKITEGIPIEYDQERALKNADFVYVKNWSAFKDYGKVLRDDAQWIMTQKKLGSAKFMHCLPVRRNVVVEDAVLDSTQSVVIQQANNRTFAAQIVLKKILKNL